VNITIEIPDDINQQLVGIKNTNAFILKAIKLALETQTLVDSDDFTVQETLKKQQNIQDMMLIKNSVKKHKKLLLKLAK
jgi:hypothetical protein